MGTKNLQAYSSLNSIIIMTMGLGADCFFLKLTQILIRTKQFNTKKRTSLFFRIQINEINLFSQQIREIDFQAQNHCTHDISRIEAINNKKPEIIDEKKKAFGFLTEKEEYLG